MEQALFVAVEFPERRKRQRKGKGGGMGEFLVHTWNGLRAEWLRSEVEF